MAADKENDAAASGASQIRSARRPLSLSLLESGMKQPRLRAILFALPKMLSVTARRYPAFRARLKEHNVVGWIGLRDGSIGRVIEFRDGKVLTRKGPREAADVRMIFQDVATALRTRPASRRSARFEPDMEGSSMAKRTVVMCLGPDAGGGFEVREAELSRAALPPLSNETVK